MEESGRATSKKNIVDDQDDRLRLRHQYEAHGVPPKNPKCVTATSAAPALG